MAADVPVRVTDLSERLFDGGLFVLSVIGAPILGCVVGTLAYSVMPPVSNDAISLRAVIAFGGIFGVIVGLPAMLFLGLPLHILLCRAQHTIPLCDSWRSRWAFDALDSDPCI